MDGISEPIHVCICLHPPSAYDGRCQPLGMPGNPAGTSLTRIRELAGITKSAATSQPTEIPHGAGVLTHLSNKYGGFLREPAALLVDPGVLGGPWGGDRDCGNGRVGF